MVLTLVFFFPPQAESIHSPYASASKILTEVSQKPGKKSDAQTIRCVLYNAEYYGRYVSEESIVNSKNRAKGIYLAKICRWLLENLCFLQLK